ncbi:tripartite tricarboxylate transporter TctB family protein [Falsirhodobacter halotolerans]|uniref:tripartite tricarboxylate transporter TctB family protein n=1 Tax=Falsirhodobacter halotolerans TaxID=1146892 RepID=UPI001FD2615C|nr:tripartite tricarboxylate transporter TctB family protein [Falsirhodobacter halotolerans]MCJ8139877.1 tripartite tricarboxylate transporter TctB family protein [Falsirhodobacter halotolerans]
MRTKRIVVALLMLVAGIGYMAMAMALPGREGVDAATVPKALAWMMIGLGVLELVGAVRLVPVDDGPRVSVGGMATVLVTLILIAGFIAALRPLGFPIAAASFLFLQFIVLTPGDRRPNYPFYAALAVGTTTLIFVTFRYGFDLLLPAGLLSAWIN